MRCKYRNKDYRAHFAQHRRRMTEPQHDYDAHRPIISNSNRTHAITHILHGNTTAWIIN